MTTELTVVYEYYIHNVVMLGKPDVFRRIQGNTEFSLNEAESSLNSVNSANLGIDK